MELIRTIAKRGTSLGINIPKDFILWMNLKKGSKVSVIDKEDAKGKMIVIRKGAQK